MWAEPEPLRAKRRDGRDPTPGAPTKDPRLGDEGGAGRLRCPKCAWEPRPGDVWCCVCFCVWNTFETGGVCPACDRVWTETQCHRCGEWSPHEDWYEPASG